MAIKYRVWERRTEVKGECETLAELENKAWAHMERRCNFSPDKETETDDKQEAFRIYEESKCDSYNHFGYAYFCDCGITAIEYDPNDEDNYQDREIAYYMGELKNGKEE